MHTISVCVCVRERDMVKAFLHLSVENGCFSSEFSDIMPIMTL